MTKGDLTEAIAAEGNVTKKDAEQMVNAALAAMVESLQAGEKIEIRGFGSFGIRRRGARTGRNPKTGAEVHVPPKRICYFKPGKKLRIVQSTDAGSTSTTGSFYAASATT
ncbi:MAG: integration host factor subunit beta [bacterium]|nr:integration host factor subunit beta [bacterium]